MFGFTVNGNSIRLLWQETKKGTFSVPFLIGYKAYELKNDF